MSLLGNYTQGDVISAAGDRLAIPARRSNVTTTAKAYLSSLCPLMDKFVGHLATQNFTSGPSFGQGQKAPADPMLATIQRTASAYEIFIPTIIRAVGWGRQEQAVVAGQIAVDYNLHDTTGTGTWLDNQTASDDALDMVACRQALHVYVGSVGAVSRQ